MPALGGLPQARKMMAQLRGKGIEDLMVIAQGDHANGISLGVFSKRAGADRCQKDLARQGIQTQIAERSADAQKSSHRCRRAAHSLRRSSRMSLKRLLLTSTTVADWNPDHDRTPPDSI